MIQHSNQGRHYTAVAFGKRCREASDARSGEFRRRSQRPGTPAWRDAPNMDRLRGSRRTRMLRCHMSIQEVGSSTELPYRAAHPRCRLLFLVPVLLAFAGCMVGPNYQRPKVSVSPSFGETGDPRLSAESTNYRDWWKAFNDPALDRLIARAYRDNLTLQQAGVRVLQARAQLGIAVGEIFPQSQQAVGSVSTIARATEPLTPRCSRAVAAASS